MKSKENNKEYKQAFKDFMFLLIFEALFFMFVFGIVLIFKFLFNYWFTIDKSISLCYISVNILKEVLVWVHSVLKIYILV